MPDFYSMGLDIRYIKWIVLAFTVLILIMEVRYIMLKNWKISQEIKIKMKK
jgi:hypothetical protein